MQKGKKANLLHLRPPNLRWDIIFTPLDLDKRQKGKFTPFESYKPEMRHYFYPLGLKAKRHKGKFNPSETYRSEISYYFDLPGQRAKRQIYSIWNPHFSHFRPNFGHETTNFWQYFQIFPEIQNFVETLKGFTKTVEKIKDYQQKLYFSTFAGENPILKCKILHFKIGFSFANEKKIQFFWNPL